MVQSMAISLGKDKIQYNALIAGTIANVRIITTPSL
jgi:hypothetical protein